MRAAQKGLKMSLIRPFGHHNRIRITRLCGGRYPPSLSPSPGTPFCLAVALLRLSMNPSADTSGPGAGSQVWFPEMHEQRLPVILGLLAAAACGAISWYSLANCTLWAVFYTCVAAALKRWRPGIAKDRKYGRAQDGYGRWAYNLSIFHQAIVLPTIAVLALIWGSPARTIDWLRAPSESLDPLSRQIFYSTAGAMAKDFWIYGQSVDLWLGLHHVMTISGCGLCLSLDAGSGLAALLAFLGEVSSATYNLHIIRPCASTKWLRVAACGCVNVFVLTASLWLVAMGNPWPKSAGYLTLCGSLFTLRCVDVTKVAHAKSC